MFRYTTTVYTSQEKKFEGCRVSFPLAPIITFRHIVYARLLGGEHPQMREIIVNTALMYRARASLRKKQKRRMREIIGGLFDEKKNECTK